MSQLAWGLCLDEDVVLVVCDYISRFPNSGTRLEVSFPPAPDVLDCPRKWFESIGCVVTFKHITFFQRLFSGDVGLPDVTSQIFLAESHQYIEEQDGFEANVTLPTVDAVHGRRVSLVHGQPASFPMGRN